MAAYIELGKANGLRIDGAASVFEIRHELWEVIRIAWNKKQETAKLEMENAEAADKGYQRAISDGT